MGKAVGHYSSLFTLPSHHKTISIFFGVCVFGGTLAVFPLKPSFQGLTLGLVFGIAFFLITTIVDIVMYYGWIRTDPIFNLRRCSALSLISSSVWFFFIILGVVISVFLGSPNIALKLFLLGFSSALILRLLVFSAASLADQGRIILSSLLQPSLCSVLIFFMEPVIGYSLSARLLLFFLFSISVAMLTVSFFISLVNRVGKKNLGINSITLFKAFLANWTENLNAPLESIFEKFGQERNIKISVLAFRAKKKIKALVVVPSLHPGPFKNVGSSPLPYIIQNTLENKLECMVCVPHGVSGHELDLASQVQNQRVIEGILNSLELSAFNSVATPFVRTKKGADAGCQIFGKCAFITLTTAPQTIEDLPQELDFIIAEEAEKRGVSPAIIIDAHNSIEGPFDLNGVVSSLKEAAVNCVEKTLIQQKSKFEIGVAKVVPEEFDVEDGMGSGGISVFIVKVGNQKTAYITIDGNNMVSGLREKILLALREIGITDGEVLTTDTHTVNGIVVTERGYHPIGEAIDHAKLIDSIREAAVTALGNLEPAEASWRIITIPKVKIIGEKQVGALCLITEETAKLSKRLAVFLFSLAGVLLVALLILL
jgi:putative membrane protein